MKIDFIECIILLCIFVFCSKYFIAGVLYLIQESEIFSYVRGYIEVKYPGSKLEYLINCPYCLSYWTGLILALMFICICLNYNNIYSYLCLALLLWISASGASIEKLKK